MEYDPGSLVLLTEFKGLWTPEHCTVGNTPTQEFNTFINGCIVATILSYAVMITKHCNRITAFTSQSNPPCHEAKLSQVQFELFSFK